MSDYRLMTGDCLEVMQTFYPDIFDSIITDPPYGLSFMGKNWDHGVPGVAFWAEAIRVAKPGAFLIAFGGTRTHHRLMVAIEDAGWEIRDMVMWLYGSGFPKSLNISKAIDSHLGVEREVIGISPNSRFNGNEMYANGKGLRGHEDYQGDPVTAPATSAAKEWDGYGTALKPAWEPIIVAMKPLEGTFAANALARGVAGLWVDGCRINVQDNDPNHRPGVTEIVGPSNSIFGNDKCRRGRLPAGRWPANLVLSEVAAQLLDEQSGELTSGKPGGAKRNVSSPFMAHANGVDLTGFGDTGGASRYFTVLPDSEPRFFYTAKASTSERNEGLDGIESHQRDASRNAAQPSMNGGEGNPFNRGAAQVRNSHPTVKPLSLLKWLVKLTKTPKGGTVLDPFMGSGTTGIACLLEGRSFVGIEKEEEYMRIAEYRMKHWQDEADVKPRKIKGKDSDYADSPLFAEVNA